MEIKTKRWNIHHTMVEDCLSHPGIREAAELLREGRLVAFPTETVYGLGADATQERAVASIYTAKGRPSDNPLIVHIGNPQDMDKLVTRIPARGRELIRRFWPGPLTLVLPHNGSLAPQVTAGLSTVGVRMPSHPAALALLQEAGVPVAAPSANRSGKPSPTDADHVWNDLAGRIDGLVDGGPTGIGVESTVVDVTGEIPVLLRPGGVTLDALRDAVGEVRVDPGILPEGAAPRSPGMKYRHYAPRGELWLVTGQGETLVRKVQRMADQAKKAGRRVGILTTEEHRHRYRADWVVTCGRRSDPSSVARELYRSLRRFDEVGAEIIVAEGFPEEGILLTVMNRLTKAAEGRVLSDREE